MMSGLDRQSSEQTRNEAGTAASERTVGHRALQSLHAHSLRIKFYRETPAEQIAASAAAGKYTRAASYTQQCYFRFVRLNFKPTAILCYREFAV